MICSLHNVSAYLTSLNFCIPTRQLVMEVDHSSGHAKQKANGLNVNHMNASYGGKQTLVRDTTITEGCLGPLPALVEWKNSLGVLVKSDCKLQVGQVQKMSFQAHDPPPFYSVSAPPFDISVPKKPVKSKPRNSNPKSAPAGASSKTQSFV
eukprot:Pompholyxophrys_punicea_v1_NODE_723_length_1393_cov_18.770553.p3 type:complete len:151 gc:universal NODE_723_length_1393_cov_18.770553:303-755(+)